MKTFWLSVALACLPATAALAAMPTQPHVHLRLALERPPLVASFSAAGNVALPGADDAASSPFAFRDARRYRDPPPPRANDRDVVLGLGRAWVGGKPPVECASTPMDAACH